MSKQNRVPETAAKAQSGITGPFWFVTALLGVLLFLTAIPGVFTIDEPYYISTLLALREGRLTVPGTDDLPASREIAWFDPTGSCRDISSTPVAPTAPPLWAPLALPFSMMGWRGLVLLNVGAFMLTIALVYHLTARLSGSVAGGVWAAAAVALGSYAIEYAQGVWPHCLSMALAFSAITLTLRALGNPSALSAAGAGWLAGLAAGVRYQNAVLLATLAATLLIRSRGRKRLLLAFVLGAALPLGGSSAINHLRLDSWNPVSKGPGYLAAFGPARATVNAHGALPSAESGREPTAPEIAKAWIARIGDSLTMFWARVGDYSAWPRGPELQEMPWLKTGEGGALFVRGVVKKSLLQSSPWIALAFFAAAVCFWSERWRRSAQGDCAWITILFSVSWLTILSVGSRYRHDGLCFNQRYLLELLAPLAVCFGMALARIPVRKDAVALGGLAGLGLASITLALPAQSAMHQWLIRVLPLALAAVLAAAWRVRRLPPATIVAPLAAAALGWALAVHGGTDLGASRALRNANMIRAREITKLTPPGSALVIWSGIKDCVGAIVLGRNQTVIDPSNDSAKTVSEVVDALLKRGDRVFLWLEAMPPKVREQIVGGREVLVVGRLSDGQAICEEVR